MEEQSPGALHGAGKAVLAAPGEARDGREWLASAVASLPCTVGSSRLSLRTHVQVGALAEAGGKRQMGPLSPLVILPDCAGLPFCPHLLFLLPCFCKTSDFVRPGKL